MFKALSMCSLFADSEARRFEDENLEASGLKGSKIHH